MPRYSPGGGHLSLEPGAVDVWLAFDAHFQAKEIQAELVALMTPPEVERMQRLHRDVGKRQFALTRALQRQVLSLYAEEVLPTRWQFQSSAEGRPSLAPPFDRTGLHFNLAHTEGVVAMAVCRHERVGVDVEKLGVASLAIADRYFSAVEAAQLREMPAEAQSRRYMRIWTLKESYLKAVGTGLSGGLGRMSFVFDPAGNFHFERSDDADAARWQFQQFEIGTDHVLSLAVLPRVGDAALHVTLREFRAARSSQEEGSQP